MIRLAVPARAARAAALAFALGALAPACAPLPDEAWLRITSLRDASGAAVSSLPVELEDATVAEAVNVELENRTSTIGVADGGTGILIRRIRIATSGGGVAFPVQEFPTTLYLGPGSDSVISYSVTVFPPGLKRWVLDNVAVPEEGLAGAARITLFAVTDEGREFETMGGVGLELYGGSSGGGDSTPALPTVTVRASEPVAIDTSPVQNGEFLIQRTGETAERLDVLFTVLGTAKVGEDFENLGSFAVIPAGTASFRVPVRPIADAVADGGKTIRLRLDPSTLYSVGNPSEAKVTVND